MATGSSGGKSTACAGPATTPNDAATAAMAIASRRHGSPIRLEPPRAMGKMVMSMAPWVLG